MSQRSAVSDRRSAATTAGKPHIQVTADGRIGWPRVVQYELLGGPEKGRLLTCPPTCASHPDPATAIPPSIDSWRGAKAWREWMDRRAAGEIMARRGYPFRPVVHDRAAYEALCRCGDIDNPRHTGAGSAVDNRAAPET